MGEYADMALDEEEDALIFGEPVVQPRPMVRRRFGWWVLNGVLVYIGVWILGRSGGCW